MAGDARGAVHRQRGRAAVVEPDEGSHPSRGRGLGGLEDVGDRRGAGGDRLDHVLEAFLDALGDLDFAFAGEELDGAHFAHVHAHRVGRATEFGVHAGKRAFGLFHRVFICHHRRGVRHQQLLGVRCLVVHLDAHVGDHADDALDLLGIQHVFRQGVVDLGIGQEAAFLALNDQLLEPLATLLGVVERSGLRFRLSSLVAIGIVRHRAILQN